MKKNLKLLTFSLIIFLINCEPKRVSNIDSNESIESNIIKITESSETLGYIDNLNINLENIKNECYYMKIDNIRIYENINKNTDFIEINNEEVMLLKIPEIEDWLYIVTNNFINQGFIFVYDISKESFYGNLDENARSGNHYKKQLNKEYEIIIDNKNINRYGPLLEIYYNDNLIKYWDSFLGNTWEMHKYLLIDYYKEYNEVCILKNYWSFATYYIYNIQHNYIVCDIGWIPYFNEIRDTAIVIDHRYYEFTGADLRIYSIRNNNYRLIKEEGIPGDTIDAYWINNDEFHRTYTVPNYIEEGKSGITIIKRNYMEFEINDNR